MERVEYGTDGYPYKLSMSTGIENTEQYPVVEATKADYENRLKADMVAMLEDLDLLIDEFDSGCGWDGYIKKVDAHNLIQQEINALKAESEHKE